ncbi:flagellar protein FlaG [Acidihalobacter prosperus]|nr:flagellar protein FlaG [Acidihalobacter prosperus]
MNQITNDLSLLTGIPMASGSPQGTAVSANAGGQVVGANAGQGGNSAPPGSPPSGKVQPGMLDQALVQVNDYLQSQSRTLQFSIDQSTHQTIIKVIDQSNGQVLRQIPPESMVALAQRLQEMRHVETTGVAVKT